MGENKIDFPDEAIILAGGKGTRLHGIVDDIPKPMAPVNGKPFLEYLINNLIKQGISHIILSVGYRHEIISKYFTNEFIGAKISYVIEDEALGTGGAIAYASKSVIGRHFWIINGDTFVDIDLQKAFDQIIYPDLSICLVRMQNFDRFGIVETDEKKITGFREKEFSTDGFINSGIYLISKDFISENFPHTRIFSFEKEILEKIYLKKNVGFFSNEGIFIDIGVPDDYFRAQFLFANTTDVKSIFNYDNSWTIFLDRDGVINQRLPDSYIKNTDEFIFLPYAIEAVKKLSGTFDRIIVVTNQQGIGKGLITQEQADEVNSFMISEITKAGGRIDSVYVCPALASSENNCRKPNPDMAIQAQKDFPEIDFHRSIMIGDSISDMIFGINLGMKTILITSKEEEKLDYTGIMVDWRIEKLHQII